MSPSPHAALLALRHEATTRYGANTLDVALGTFRCGSCGAEVADPSLRSVAVVPYTDLVSLRSHAERVAAGLVATPPCEACQAETALVHFDYHSYLPSQGRDLVIRCGGAEPVATQLWDPAGGYQDYPEPSEEDQRSLRYARCVRLAEIAPHLGGLEELSQETLRLLDELGYDPLLLAAVPALLASGQAGVCARIAESHRARFPQDPAGHYWLAEVIARCVNAQALAIEALEEAEGHVATTLRLAPEFAPIHVTRGTIAGMRGDDEGAAEAYLRALELDPDQDAVHYNLGTLLLERDPAAALEHFQKGAALAPDDADYPLGCARALLALDRPADARPYAEAAQSLEADHPRLPEVLAQLR